MIRPRVDSGEAQQCEGMASWWTGPMERVHWSEWVHSGEPIMDPCSCVALRQMYFLIYKTDLIKASLG